MKIIRTEEVEPTINPASTEQRDGSQTHRRILSRLTGGPAALDIGYNRTTVPLDVAIAYAYDRDEFCYNARGSVRVENEAGPATASEGMFMWRPAGAATFHFKTEGEYISICAFGPARIDAWSHRLPAEKIGQWDGDPADKPKVHFRAADDVVPSVFPNAAVTGSITHRLIFDTPRMEVSQTIMVESASLAIAAHNREDVYWLERGRVSLSAGGESLSWSGGEFLQVRPGENIDRLHADADAVFIRWSAWAT